MNAPVVPYAGIATRAIALAVDVAIVQVVVLLGAAILALVASLVGGVRLDTLTTILAALAWVAAVVIYFVLFWSTAGQTPGMRLMALRVMTPAGTPPGPARSVVRVIGLALAIVPLFAGFLPVLVDGRRRALQDMLAGTVVVYAGRYGVPAPPLSHWTASLPSQPGGRRIGPDTEPSKGAQS
jgi:uncharacterized RDD family membrane protein YckC